MKPLEIPAVFRRLLLPAIIALAGAGNAVAATCKVPGTSTIDFGQINVQPDAQVGDAIASTSRSYAIDCPADNYHQFDPAHTGYHMIFISDMPNAALGGVWDTGTAGIGIRVTNTTHNIVVSGNQCKDYSYVEQCRYAPSQYNPEAFTLTVNFRFELIKIGPIAANTTLKNGYIIGLSSYSIRDGQMTGSKPYSNASGIMLGSTKVVAATCTVLTRDLSVPLPALPASQLKLAGATGGDTSFQIGLDCGAGKNVYITLSDAADPGNATEHLTPASDSSASGVRLRILNAGVPVRFGPDSTAIGNPGQWLVGNSASTSAIPLTVQYISTGAPQPGTVSAAATFTLSYQ